MEPGLTVKVLSYRIKLEDRDKQAFERLVEKGYRVVFDDLPCFVQQALVPTPGEFIVTVQNDVHGNLVRGHRRYTPTNWWPLFPSGSRAPQPYRDGHINVVVKEKDGQLANQVAVWTLRALSGNKEPWGPLSQRCHT